MGEVTRDMVKAQLKSAKTKEALNDAMVSAFTRHCCMIGRTI